MIADSCRAGMDVVVSMEPLPWPQVPALTARAAQASFPKGNLAMRIRDVLGEVYSDGRFAAAFASAGRPAVSPGQLMMVTVLQFTENLTDRQAADAARDRMSWKYALVRHEAPLFRVGVKGPCRWSVAAGW
jgi:transposase